MITVVERAQIEGTDGEWYSPHGGMPDGITWTGQGRSLGFALNDGAATFGKCYPTQEEAEHIAAQMNEDRASYF